MFWRRRIRFRIKASEYTATVLDAIKQIQESQPNVEISVDCLLGLDTGQSSA